MVEAILSDDSLSNWSVCRKGRENGSIWEVKNMFFRIFIPSMSDFILLEVCRTWDRIRLNQALWPCFDPCILILVMDLMHLG